ncbi:MAG TPA: LpqN/LpqT family lipoprotein [Candidatus Saccharimonadales bacterium]|nr:LpqN/LpqT family lipoprotein [Candidatus Saccharimonadales bacterium]
MNWLKKLSGFKVIGLVIAVALAAGFIGYNVANTDNRSESQTDKNVAAPAYGRITYPKDWQEAKTISAVENQADVISKASRHNPDATTIIRAVATKLEANFDIKTLPDEVVKSLSKEIEDFSLVSKEIAKVDNYQSVEIRYKQKGYEYLMVIIPQPQSSRTFYLTFSAKDDDFEKIGSHISEINQSVAKYISSNP